MKKLFILAIVVALVAGLVPISGQSEVFLKIGCLGEPSTLNVWNVGDDVGYDVWAAHVVKWFYPSLYYRKPVTLEPLPDFCTLPYDQVMANSPDGLTYTFPLRNNVKWDDGKPVTAYDFEFAYNLIVELQLPDYFPIYTDVEYISAVDDYTLEIKLGKCTPQWEENIIFHFAVPKQQFSPMLDESLQTPISAGPFSFYQWVPGSFIKLRTNPNYYGKGRKIYVQGVGVIQEGPFYDGLILKLYSTTDAALLGIQKGEVDFIWWNLDPGYIAQLETNPDITIEKSGELGFYYLAPNMAKPPFDDKILLQALAYLVDKEFIVSRVLQGYGGVAHSVVMPAAGPWYNPNVNKYGSGMTRADRIAKAKEMLTAAGYTVPDVKYPEGVIKLPKGGDTQPSLIFVPPVEMQPFSILVPPADYDSTRAMAGVLIQEWWREIGIPVTTKPTSIGEIATFESMTFDWFILGWGIGGTGYPDFMRYFFHSDQAVPNGNNLVSYKNRMVDQFLEDLMTNCDREILIQDAWMAQEMIIDDVAYIPLYYRTMNEAHRNDTFTGWFTQLGGIAGRESPTSCLLYLMPFNKGCPRFNTVIVIIGIVLTVAGGLTVWRLRRRARKIEDMKKKGGVTTNKWLTEKLVSGFWVYPYVKTIQETHHVTLAIVKGLWTEKIRTPLLGQAVDVGLLDTNNNALQLVQRPEDGLLPVVGSASISANAEFLFTASARPLKLMRVTINEDTKTFSMGETTTARGKKNIAGHITSMFRKCCVTLFDVPAHRSGRRLTDNRLHESFDMRAEFDAKDKCRCRRCEYRQYIRGIFTFDSFAAIHQLPDGPLDPVEWREDGVPHHFGHGHHMFYGHRDDGETSVDIYRAPDRATGSQYQGYDNPLIGHPNPKVTMVMNLEFRGEIIDVGSGKVIRTTTWTVNHSQP